MLSFFFLRKISYLPIDARQGILQTLVLALLRSRTVSETNPAPFEMGIVKRSLLMLRMPNLFIFLKKCQFLLAVIVIQSH